MLLVKIPINAIEVPIHLKLECLILQLVDMSNIKIYGQLENATTDNKLADASQIYDSSL
jgi:hypothetical protein